MHCTFFSLSLSWKNSNYRRKGRELEAFALFLKLNMLTQKERFTVPREIYYPNKEFYAVKETSVLGISHLYNLHQVNDTVTVMR